MFNFPSNYYAVYTEKRNMKCETPEECVLIARIKSSHSEHRLYKNQTKVERVSSLPILIPFPAGHLFVLEGYSHPMPCRPLIRSLSLYILTRQYSIRVSNNNLKYNPRLFVYSISTSANTTPLFSPAILSLQPSPTSSKVPINISILSS